MQANGSCRQEFSTDLHVSAVVLDVDSIPTNNKKGVQLWIEHKDSQILVANLSRQTPQVALDIGFSKDEKVVFITKGEGDIHLHGYFAPEDGNDDENTL